MSNKTATDTVEDAQDQQSNRITDTDINDDQFVTIDPGTVDPNSELGLVLWELSTGKLLD